MEAVKPLTIAPRRPTVLERLRLLHMDSILLGASVALAAVSVFVLAVATRDEIAGQPGYFATRQALYAVVGIAGMIAVGRLDYTRLREFRVSIYAAMIAVIAVVLFGGAAVRGSQRWIELPLFRFQPSELAKVLLCASLAAFAFERVRRNGFDIRATVGLLALGLAPAALVALQPDLGTSAVSLVVTLTILYVAGIPWQHFAAIGAAAALIGGGALAAGPALDRDVLHSYQEDRLTAFLHPGDDPSDSGYQAEQAVIAVGSGELAGRGDDATQAELLFLPERHTDFVFAVIGERFGLAGAALVVLLYGALLWRALRIARLATSFYGTLLAAGIVAMLAFQVVVNIGMNLAIMPVAGITLPLLSYGGSSVVGTFLALGLLQGIHVQAHRSRELFQSR
ncbi:MAG TPA: FtsW/RodA/SpoVE family cell cycle protein [Solirubrobacterales bacterium]|nr:FtsW/RodA/SpoVE family cell cycle protein [Solirubrobacterales bacterium]